MNPEHYRLTMWESSGGTCPVEQFLEGLKEPKRAAAEAALVYVLARQGAAVCRSEWGKALGGGLYEFRIRHELDEILRAAGRGDLASKWTSAEAKVLLRVFFTMDGDKVVLLLAGYDKGADPSDKRQQREINTARKHLKAHKGSASPVRKFLDRWKKRRKAGVVHRSNLDRSMGYAT
jgi:hypothetical protein